MRHKIQIKAFSLFLIVLLITFSFYSYSCSSYRVAEQVNSDTLNTKILIDGIPLEIAFVKGSEHNHPLMAIWLTDTSNQHLETLYISQSLAKGVFEHGDNNTGKWMPGPVRRPAALPVWSHSRGVKEKDGLYIPTPETPIVDAITGATPPNNFILNTQISKPIPSAFFIYFEINQPWDWNKYWTNNKFPDDEAYKTSSQPALVYRAKILQDELQIGGSKTLELIGHSHHNGSSRSINSDLSTITSAKNITETITVKF